MPLKNRSSKTASIDDFNKEIGAFCVALILTYFSFKKVELYKKPLSFDLLRQHCRIVDQYHPLLHYIIGLLSDFKVIEMIDHGQFYFKRDIEKQYSCLLLQQELEKKFPELSGVISLLREVFIKYPFILQGEAPTLSALFPKGDLAYLQRHLEAYNNFSYLKDCKDEFINYILEHMGDKAEILEIGGGTGELTWYILPCLKGQPSYLFTDISRYFLIKCQEKARQGNFPNLETQLFNINQSPMEQSLGNKKFDFIFGLNVLHLAKNLDQTLHLLKTLLKPQGKLCIIEYTFSPVWANLIWGLLPEWWTDIKNKTPRPCLLSQQKWHGALNDAGFKAIYQLPASEDKLTTVDACLIISEAESF